MSRNGYDYMRVCTECGEPPVKYTQGDGSESWHCPACNRFYLWEDLGVSIELVRWQKKSGRAFAPSTPFASRGRSVTVDAKPSHPQQGDLSVSGGVTHMWNGKEWVAIGPGAAPTRESPKIVVSPDLRDRMDSMVGLVQPVGPVNQPGSTLFGIDVVVNPMLPPDQFVLVNINSGQATDHITEWMALARQHREDA